MYTDKQAQTNRKIAMFDRKIERQTDKEKQTNRQADKLTDRNADITGRPKKKTDSTS